MKWAGVIGAGALVVIFAAGHRSRLANGVDEKERVAARKSLVRTAGTQPETRSEWPVEMLSESEAWVLIRARLKAIEEIPDWVDRYHAVGVFYELLERAPVTVVRSLSREWLDDPALAVHWDEVLPTLITRWATEYPGEAWPEILAATAGLLELEGEALIAGLRAAALKGWAKSDPAQAWRVFEKMDDLASDTVLLMINNEQIALHVFESYAARNPEAAREALIALSGTTRPDATLGYLRGLPSGTDWPQLAAGLPDLLTAQSDGRPPREPEWDGWLPDANRTLAERWLENDMSAALQWYVEVSKGSEERPTLVANLLSREMGTHDGRVLRWIRDQPWKWPHTDLIARRLVLDTFVFLGDYRPALLKTMRTEQARFELLKGVLDSRHVQLYQPAEARLQFVKDNYQAANLSATHGDELRVRMKEAERTIEAERLEEEVAEDE